MEYSETLALTEAMTDSGGRHSFPYCVDKHSTGGVGDNISLTSLPIVASCGAPVAKLSGRGLGTTGGTIDKLETIPGFSFDPSEERFKEQVEEVGLASMEARDLAPVDKEIYALRDHHHALFAPYRLVHRLQKGRDRCRLSPLRREVGLGRVSVKTPGEARELAGLLMRLSRAMGIEASALITSMDDPLGIAVGNAPEVRESVRFLQGEASPADLSTMTRAVVTCLLRLKGISEPEGAISSGAAYEKFRKFVAAQGGEVGALDNLPASGEAREVVAPQTGHVARLGASGIGRTALLLGAGRGKRGAARTRARA